jgi:hypothetical protein
MSRDLVKESYAHGGRPSIDPVVFWHRCNWCCSLKLSEPLACACQLLADKLSVRWYVGYDLDELLPDHSSPTRIRERYGVEVFRHFFEAIVEQCQQAGLVWGKELCAIRSLETVCSLMRGISGFVPKGPMITTRLMLGAIPNLLGESRQRSPEGLDWPSIRKAGENEDKR